MYSFPLDPLSPPSSSVLFGRVYRLLFPLSCYPLTSPTMPPTSSTQKQLTTQFIAFTEAKDVVATKVSLPAFFPSVLLLLPVLVVVGVASRERCPEYS